MKKFVTLFVLLIMLLLAPSVHGQTIARRWLVPNLIDLNGDPRNYCCFDTLFDNPVDYQQNMLEADVWGFYLTTVQQNPSNWIPKYLTAAQPTGIQTAIEGGPFEQYGCQTNDPYTNGVLVAQGDIAAFQPLYQAGGQLDYIQLDSPFHRLIDICGYNGGQMNSSIYGYLVTMHQAYPNIQVGLTVDYPNWTAFGVENYRGDTTLDVATLTSNLLSLINQNGANLAFIHADNPWEFMNCTAPHPAGDCASIAWWARLRNYANLVQGQQVRFGLIYNSALSQWSTETDTQYYNRTVQYLQTAQSKGINPDDYVIESWYKVPTLLPPRTTSYTYLWDTNQIFRNARGTCNGVPGIIC